MASDAIVTMKVANNCHKMLLINIQCLISIKKYEYCPQECLIRTSGGEFFRRLKDGHPDADITLDITEMPELETPSRCRRLLEKKQYTYINK